MSPSRCERPRHTEKMDSVPLTSHASQKRLFFTEFLQNFYRVVMTGRATPDMLFLSGTVG